MTKRSFRWLFVFAILLTVTSQAQIKYTSVADAINNMQNLTGLSGPSSVNWLEGGKKYSIKDEESIIKLYDPATDKEEIVFDPANKEFPGTDKKFTYSTFEWSKDFQYIVFRTNVRPVWRNSGYADYYMYSRLDKTIKLIAENAYTAEIS